MTRVLVPGDKSISQRALIFGALADGVSRLRGVLAGEDARSTAAALRALGAGIPELPEDGSEIAVRGVGLGGLVPPERRLDLGNSGTGARLLLGVLAGSGLEAVVTGDASLRSRPMRRIVDPLTELGASFEALERDGRLPLRVRGAGRARTLAWSSPVASAQVKSAILLGGVVGGAAVSVSEPHRSRDHSERMLRAMGATVLAGESPEASGWRVDMPMPPSRLAPLDYAVPRDPSSAAFAAAAAVVGATDGEVELPGVGLNPDRIAFFKVLRRMGADVKVDHRRHAGNPSADFEPVGEVHAGPSNLRGLEILPQEVPGMIDELPLVAVLGAVAEGETVISGAGELRAKESDRISALVTNLRAVGAQVEERPDGLTVFGSRSPLQGRVRAFADHRIAMAFAVLGRIPGNEIQIDTPEVAAVSYPGFWRMLAETCA